MIQFQNDFITVFQSELYATTSTVIESEEAITVVDPNLLPSEVAKIKQFVNERIQNKQLYLILTHSDFDHIIGAGAFPEAKIIATKTFENQPHKQEIIDEINHFDHMYYLTRPYPVIYPNVNLIIDNNGINLQLGDLTYVFYLSPGHTNDGLFFYIKNLKTLVAGDYLSNIEIPFITSSYTDYLNTVLLMEHVMDTNEVELLIPGHGKATQNYKERIDFSLWYLENIEKSVNIERDLMERFSFFEGMKEAHLTNLKFAKGSDENN